MSHENENAQDSVAAPSWADEKSFHANSHTHDTVHTDTRKQGFVVKVLPDGPKVRVPNGRQAETMRMLIRRGSRGFTSGEASRYAWARRTSAYICELRKYGIPIDTRREKTPDGATVGRYVLAADVEALPSQTTDGSEA